MLKELNDDLNSLIRRRTFMYAFYQQFVFFQKFLWNFNALELEILQNEFSEK